MLLPSSPSSPSRTALPTTPPQPVLLYSSMSLSTPGSTLNSYRRQARTTPQHHKPHHTRYDHAATARVSVTAAAAREEAAPGEGFRGVCWLVVARELLDAGRLGRLHAADRPRPSGPWGPEALGQVAWLCRGPGTGFAVLGAERGWARLCSLATGT